MDIYVEAEATDEIQGVSKSMAHLGENAEREFTLQSQEGKQMSSEKSYVLSFVSKNIRGQSRKQVFEITNGLPLLVTCDPELV